MSRPADGVESRGDEVVGKVKTPLQAAAWPPRGGGGHVRGLLLTPPTSGGARAPVGRGFASPPLGEAGVTGPPLDPRWPAGRGAGMTSLVVGKVKTPLQAAAGRPRVGASSAAPPSSFTVETAFSHTLADGKTTSCGAGLGMVKMPLRQGRVGKGPQRCCCGSRWPPLAGGHSTPCAGWMVG